MVILVGMFHQFLSIQPASDIWITYGMGKHHKFLPINSLCERLGQSRSIGLPVFHAFSGSDTSFFNGKGKKIAWKTWQAYEDVTGMEDLAGL